MDKESLDKTNPTPGTFVDWDIRDNIFTPAEGARINVPYSVNHQLTGSDFQYQMLNGSLNWFFPLKSNWVCGFRTEVKHAFDDLSFYALPSIIMRE